MITLEKTSVMNFENAIRGARNPMNSWSKSDSYYDENGKYILGANDLDLARRLTKAGSDHRKFMRQIFVSVDITAPMYWWAEADTYKVGTVRNSCSKMHKLLAKPFEMSDFSCECPSLPISDEGTVEDVFTSIISILNGLREYYLSIADEALKKQIWYAIQQVLPESYNQKSTLTLDYEVILNMYHARKAHKLNEWHTFCDWAESLPYFKEIVGIE